MIGCHVEKYLTNDKSYYNLLKDFYENNKWTFNLQNDEFKIKNYFNDKEKENRFEIPCQIFIGSPQSSVLSIIPENDIERLSNYIIKNKIKLFIHGPYIVNLVSLKKDALLRVERDFNYATKLNAQGIIFHVGKYTKNEISDSLINMKNTIEFIISNLVSTCPFILETPAGQGSELLTNMTDFITFSLDLYNKYPTQFGVCIDTCHVFAAGYDPYEYIKTVNESGLKISLVHFNDSLTPKGSKKDRHQYYGKGKIDISILNNCITYCKSNEIPMIIECSEIELKNHKI